MHVHWYLYRFDYERYSELRQDLESAETPDDFEQLAGDVDVNAILDALDEKEITAGEVRSAFVQALCFIGTPLPADMALARLVARLQRISGLEDTGDLLNGMLTGGHNIEPWLLPQAGLAGILTPEEVDKIHSIWTDAEPRMLKRARSDGRRRRRGGLLGTVLQLLHHLRADGPQTDDTFRLIRELIVDAVDSGSGLAALAVEP